MAPGITAIDEYRLGNPADAEPADEPSEPAASIHLDFVPGVMRN
jgi:hypothetical protein